jgi:hypothetical protein
MFAKGKPDAREGKVPLTASDPSLVTTRAWPCCRQSARKNSPERRPVFGIAIKYDFFFFDVVLTIP